MIRKKYTVIVLFLVLIRGINIHQTADKLGRSFGGHQLLYIFRIIQSPYNPIV